MIGVLNRKLLRDVVRLRMQAFAIALVMAAGVATIVLGTGTQETLSQTRASYYDNQRYADLFVNVTRAPLSIVPDIAAIGGVAAVEPRIVKIALADLPDMAEPASVMLVSIPHLHLPVLNQLYLRSGRLPEKDGEAAISYGFARAHGLMIGSTVRVLINGARRDIRVSGVAMSPEFIYALGPGDVMADQRRFGILWMPQPALAAAYDLDGAFSNLVVKLVPGVPAVQVASRIDQMLRRYGGQGVATRKDQPSHAFLDAELQQLKSISRVLPPIFLVVAAFLVNMTLVRLVALEREQIGLLKALGYSSFAIARHYIAFAALIAVGGIVLGWGAGWWLGHGLTIVYMRFFNFPYLVFSRDPSVYALAALVTLAAAVLGAALAVARIVRLAPAVAMQPPQPPNYHKLLRGLLVPNLRISRLKVMGLRHLLHWRGRTAASVVGVAFAVAILVGSLCTYGSVNLMMEVTFQKADREDASIAFNSTRPYAALFEARRLPGVLQAEPYRAVSVEIRYGPLSRRLSLVGKPQGASLSRVLDASFHPVDPPLQGLMISRALAQILGVNTGDIVEIELLEGSRRVVRVAVSGIVEGFLGLAAYMDLDAMNRLLDEGRVISGVHLAVDHQQLPTLYARLKGMPAAAFIALERIALQNFRNTLAQNIFYQIATYASLAAIIAFGVVYNFARIALSEQGRELASLRVLGFSRREVSGMLLGELAVIIGLAQPLGWLAGYGLALLVFGGFSTELYRVPLVIGREVYAYASLIVVTAAVVSGLVVRRRIDRLDLIAVLKTRE